MENLNLNHRLRGNRGLATKLKKTSAKYDMKHKTSLAALLLAATILPGFSQGNAFIYQGRLNASGAPATGLYDFQFYLRDALAAGSPVGATNTLAAVGVTNGLFTATLDFGNQFPGAPRWLEMAVRTNGGASVYTVLTPRTPLLAMPYAITASNLTGTVSASQLTGILASSQLSGTYSGAVTLNSAANSIAGNGSGLTSLNAANVSQGILPDVRLSGNVAMLPNNQMFSGRDSFSQGLGVGTSSTLEGDLNIATNVYLFSKSVYLRGETGTDHNHGLAYSGSSVTNIGNGNLQVDGPVLWGFGGGALASVNGGAHALLTWTPSQVLINGTNTGGWAASTMMVQNGSTNNNASPALRVTTYGNTPDGAMAVSANGTGLIAKFGNAGSWVGSIDTNGGVAIDQGQVNAGALNPGLTFGNPGFPFGLFGPYSSEGIASKRTSGGNQLGLDFYTAGNSRLHIEHGGNVGIGVSSAQTMLDVGGQVRAQGVLSTGAAPLGSSLPSSQFAFASAFSEGTFSNWNGTGNDAACRRLLGADDYHCGFGEAFGPGIASPVIWMYDSSGNAFEVRKVSFNQQVPAGQKLFAVHSDGTTEVQVLQVTGGSDLAEPFHVADADIPEGSLVVIDEEHAGELKRSTEAYDHHVAGIISGANGIHPGLTLHQQGRLEGGRNVALTGRVYALADASSHDIKPGDLLTSSFTPGMVMKACDLSRAQGAIVGKAMSALSHEKGLVLVLVSLQ